MGGGETNAGQVGVVDPKRNHVGGDEAFSVGAQSVSDDAKRAKGESVSVGSLGASKNDIDQGNKAIKRGETESVDVGEGMADRDLSMADGGVSEQNR